MSTKLMFNVRVELFFRDKEELRERINFLASKGVTAFNIVNKNNKDDLKQWCNIIRKDMPDSKVCVHYSLKYNKCRIKDGAFHRLSQFVTDMGVSNGCTNLDSASVSGRNEILLVTGSGPKGNLDSVRALQKLQSSEKVLAKNTIMAVAFNPFFPSNEDSEVEKKRLINKLKTGMVNKIYLQFGTDANKLRSALDWLVLLRENHGNFSICGSIFLPTKKLIAQQRFRPWNGVFLSEEFLNSKEDAHNIVLNILRLYKEFDCEILFEAPGVRNENDIKIVEKLLDEVLSSECSGASTLDGDSDEVKENVTTKRRRTDALAMSPMVSKDLLGKPAIVLFGSHDVRLHDNLAIQSASFHKHVIPVFIWSRKEQGEWGVIGAAEVVLKDALAHLNHKLHSHDLRLICRTAEDSINELCKLCNESGASAVYMNIEHTPEGLVLNQRRIRALEDMKIVGVECQSSLLYEPSDLSLAPGFHGGHWGTLMPFLKACKKQLGTPRRPIQRNLTIDLLNEMKGPETWPTSTSVENLDLAIVKGKLKWDLPIKERFVMSEEIAFSTLNAFFDEGFSKYEKERSRADIDHSTSKLSAHLRIGTLSPNELYHKVEDADIGYEKKTFSRRLFWRDLAYFHLLKFPQMRNQSIRVHYDDTKWVSEQEEKIRFDAWKTGNTGYPLVDAGMRELYATGWMTQSVRMVVASFLTEYLRINWVKGCEWFHYTLVDADSAINPMMWQNAGRSGIDQWNFVMSPIAASQDVTGNYTKKWVPELSKLPKSFLHKPWDAPEQILQQANVKLGETYPRRIVTDLNKEREISDKNVLEMRRKYQRFTDDRGYDLIHVDGIETVVFTKKQFRIDRKGQLIKVRDKDTVSNNASKRGRGRSQARKRDLH